MMSTTMIAAIALAVMAPAAATASLAFNFLSDTSQEEEFEHVFFVSLDADVWLISVLWEVSAQTHRTKRLDTLVHILGAISLQALLKWS